MKLFLALAALVLVAGSAHAQTPTVIDVRLSEFKFAPAQIELTHGVAYVLRLTNVGAHAHDLSAKDFFQTVTFGPGSSARTVKGDVEVPKDQIVEVELIPAKPGIYEMHCTRPMHSMMGMKGKIVVN